MKGETQHVYSIKDPEPSSKKQNKDFECHSNLEGGELNSPQSDGLPKATFSTKDKEPHSQREAVIRPQQAGKIDFKSLHNRPKLLSNGPWSAGKGTLQSPTGKSRVRDKTRRAGKGERGHQQLYRLTIANSRANPTIGIAYPQQKVTPPKKLEASKRPASGSYRFNVPSIPEREAELQQEEVSFNRYFQEAPSSLTSTNYTSQAPTTAPPYHSRKDQQQAGPPQDSPSLSRPPHYLEFQVNRADSWPSPEKSFPGANYEVTPTKPCPFPEGSKSSSHCFVPFQYSFQVSEPFPVEAASQEYVGTSLAAHHGAFVFHSSSRDWQEDPLNKGSFDNLSQEGRTYSLPLQSAPFLHPQTQGAQLPSPLPCYKGHGDPSPDVNGAISSSGANDQNPTPFLEGQGIFSTSLHGSMPKAVTKGQSSAKHSIPSPRMPTPSNALRRNIPQNSLPQVHFPNKVFGGCPANGMSPASMPLDKDGSTVTEGHSKVTQPWDGGNKTFTTIDPDSALYSTTAAAAAAAAVVAVAAPRVGNQFPFECQTSSEQRPHVQKGPRVTWQQIHLTSALPNPNRIEPSRQLNSQKLSFPPGTSEWQGVGKMPKTAHLSSPPGYPGKIRGPGDKITAQRSEPIQLNGAPAEVYPYEGAKEVSSPSCDARTKPLFFGISQPQASPRRATKLSLALSPPGLSATSPVKSPLPSPVPNPTSNSTCSSLSPLSASPVNHSSEDSQLSVPLASSSYFQPPIHPKENKTFHSPDPSSDLSIPYQPETMKAFHFPVDGPKDENLFKCLQESQFPRAVTDVSKGGLDSFEGELPPYSSHHFLANSISSASLDQLDVLLTCKQCDQNYSNLTSFLEHRQYCGLHSTFLAEMRDGSRLTEGRKRPLDALRAPQSGSGLQGPKGPSDPYSHLLSPNKSADFMLDGESKGESKEDPLKGHFFTNSLSLMASDLEIEDAKLDSLITEALNGLEYQSDNPEIDSSFIDVFTDEELSATKGLGSSQSYKTKEGAGPESKAKRVAPDAGQGPPPPTVSHCEEGYLTRRRSQSRLSEQPPPEKEQTSKTRERGRGKRVSLYKKELAPNDPLGTGGNNKMGKASRGRPRRKFSKTSSTPTPTTRPISRELRKQPRRSSPDSEPDGQVQDGAANTHIGPRSPKRHRFSKKEGKRKKTRNGTWSKELIHKIVQQKNKPHKLQVKNGRIMQFSLVTPKPVPVAKSGQFGEYDYISDSDEDRRGCSLGAPRKRQLESSSINGRPRHNFLRQNRGDKELGQKEGRKRYENSQEDSSDEAGKRKESVSLSPEKACQPSPGDDQNTNLASQIEKQSQSTDKENSDKEKESIHEIRSPSDSDHTFPLPTGLPQLPNQEETSPENYPLLEDFSKKSKSLAKALSARTKLLPSSKSNYSLSSFINENGNTVTEEKTMQSEESVTSNPSQTSSNEKAASESKMGETHIEIVPREVSESATPSTLRDTTHNTEPPFSPFNEDTLKYQTGELMNPSQVSNSMDISYTEANMEYLKNHDPNADPKEFALPSDCYDGDPIRIMLSNKGHNSYESSTNETSPRQKDLEDHFDGNLYSKPLVLGSSHVENMYLDQDGTSPNTFEPRPSKIQPYTAESDPGKVSPPLSFDSSSIFSSLPVTGFDTPLYGSMSLSKVSYIPFACESTSPSKSTELEQQYSPFLHEKDWTLEEVSPVLSDDMSRFHDLSVEKSLVKKFPDEGTVTPSQIPLPGKIDYNVPFMNNMSEDELEIKRLVTELESELQTSKLDDATPGVLQSPEHFIALDAHETTKQFSPSPLGQEPEHDKHLFLAHELTNLESTNLIAPKSHSEADPSKEKEKVARMDGDYGSHQENWSCAISFDPLTTGMPPNAHEDTVTIDPFGSPLTCDHFQLELQEADISKQTSCSEIENESLISSDPSLPNVSEKLGLLASAESLTKIDPIQESMGSKNRETSKMTKQDPLQLLPRKTGEDMFPEPHEMAQTLSEPPKLEAFVNPATHLKSEMGFQDDKVSVLDTTSSSDARNFSTSEKNAFKKANRIETPKSSVISHQSEQSILEENEEAVASVSYPPMPICEKTGNKKASLFEVLSLAKDPVCGDETVRTSQGSTANPLQELQLFVARTVQNNGEEKMPSCLTELLSASLQLPNTSPSDLKGEDQEDEHMTCGHNNNDGVMEGEQATPLSTRVGIQLFPETSGNPGSVNETESFLTKQSKVGSPKAQNHVTQLCQSPEPGDLQICLDGVSQDTNPSPFSNTSDSSGAKLTKREDQYNRELEQDHNIETWTFKKHQQSPLGPVSLEKEELGGAITETQSKSGAWGKEEKQLPSAEIIPDRPTVLPAYPPSPKHLLEKDYWKTPTISVSFSEEASVSPRQHLQTPPSGEDSALGLPLQMTASSQQCLQGDGAESLLTTMDAQDEKDEYKVLLHNPERRSTPSSLEKTIYNPEKSLKCCPPQSPVGKHTAEDVHSAQSVFQDQNISGNGIYCLEKDFLNNQVEPREEEPRSSSPPFNLSHATSSPLAEDASRKAPIHDSTIANIPHLGQNNAVRRMPMNCTCIELACPHHMENQPRFLPDVTLNIHSPKESKAYPEGPRDYLIIREAKVEKDQSSQQEREVRNNEEDICSVAMGPTPSKMLDTNIGDPEDVCLLAATEVSSFNSASSTVDAGKDSLRINSSKSHRNDLPESSVDDVQSHLDSIQEKSRFKKKPPPLRNGQWKRSPPQSNDLQVTCDICSLSFKSKPGLMRHKAVKHRIKNNGPSLPNKTTRSNSVPLEKEPKISRHHSKKSLKAVREKACGSLINSSPTSGPPLENEPNNTQEHEVSPGLSGVEFGHELTHELLHSDLVNGKVKVQPQSLETGKSDKSHGRKPSPKKLDRRRKGRKRQSKEPTDLNSDSEGKLITGVKKKQVKRYSRKNACTEVSDLEKNILEVCPAVSLDRPDSSSSSTIANYPGQSNSSLLPLEKDWTHSVQSSLSARPVDGTFKDLDEMGNQILFTEEKLGQKTINNLMNGQGRLESPSTRDQVQVLEEAWRNNFVRPGEEGLCIVYNEMHEDTHSTNEEEYVMEKRKLEEGTLGKHDLPLKQAPLSPAQPDLPLGASDPEKRKTITTNSLPQVFSEDTVMDSEVQEGNKGEQNKEPFAKDQAKVDLQHLFDDDATFSLLFPRDDHFSRRKCTRVYGKGPKKPKPVIETSGQMVGSTEMFSNRLPSDLSDTDSFCVTQEDPCSYESMSFHDAFTLDMCHGNDPWSLSPGLGTHKPDSGTDNDNKMGLNLDDDEMLTYLCPNNRLESIPSLHISPAVWNDLEVLDHCNEMSFKSPLEAKTEYSLGETSPEPPELEVETYAGHIPRNLGSPELHPIDIELLSTKFEMRDMHFFSTCEDCTGQSDPSTLSFKKMNEHIQPNKQKEEEGKRGRSRNDMTIKTREKHYKCKVCFQWFLTLGELDFHKLTHNPSPPPTCYMCVQRKFSSREQLKEHLKGKHAKNKIGLWACGMCLKEISDVWMYNEHLREHAAKFARKGQVQKCMTGLPTCFGEDNAVTQFLNTIMNRKPRPSRGKRSASKGSKDLKVQESKGSQDILEGGGKNKPLAPTNTPAHSSFPTTTTAPSSSSKVGFPDPGPSGEQPSKAVPMHPQCKDPSRDCHHCGKQFPKPFKLQRHLVVHSLEKIYMCTRCPKFYKETRELRGHLSQEHGVKEKPEIKHTTLYACELCADVMHVIKKSFICSTCNYTFSKKEQYERHMEKHLAEGNRTFKFRGVMRPGAGAREGKERKKKEISSQESMPPNKKRKVTLPNSLLGPDGEETSGTLDPNAGENPALGDKSPLILHKRFLEEASSSPARLSNEEKPKNLMNCFSNHLDKMEGYSLELLQLPPPCLSPLSDTPLSDTPEECKESNSMALLCIEESKDDLSPRSPIPFLETSKLEQDLSILPIGRSQEASENLTLHLAPVQSRHTNAQNKPVVDADKEILDYPNSPGHTTTETPLVRTGKKIPTSHSNKTEAPWPKEPQKVPGSGLSETIMPQKESSSKLISSKIPHPAQPLKDRTVSPILNRVTKDTSPQQKTTASHVPKEVASSISSAEDVPRPTTLKTKPNQSPGSKDSVGSNVKEGGGGQPKPTSTHLKNETAMISTKPDHKDLGVSPDKTTLTISTKAFSKRQKEHKGLGHKGSLGSRENIKGDEKKKKAPEMSKGEGPRDYKKAEWTGNNSSIPSSRRRGTQDSRVSKPRPSGTSSQLKKTVPDPYNQKKIETHHHKRNPKCKKGNLGKSFREVVPKGNPSSLHSTLKRGRTVQGAKPAETHKYRTVESQNNLLSQLFGQKLTSFKIPLRRDTSE